MQYLFWLYNLKEFRNWKKEKEKKKEVHDYDSPVI